MVELGRRRRGDSEHETRERAIERLALELMDAGRKWLDAVLAARR